jgi:hypothetical protein
MSTFTIAAEDKVTLPGIGIVTGTVEYFSGCAGTRWEPPEEACIETASLKDASGAEVDNDLLFEENEAGDLSVLTSLENQVWALMDALYDGWNADERFWD